MPTRKQLQNLRRGGIHGTPESASRARAAKAALRTQENELGETAAADPWAAYQELHATMTRHISKLLRDEERSGGKPSRDVTDRLREYRVTTQALSEYRADNLMSTEATAFFATLHERLANIQQVTTCGACGARVEIVKPVGEPPE